MECKHCGHETDENHICPDCGEPAAAQTAQGKGMLIAGRLLLLLAIAAAVFTLILFIHTTVENGQDQIIEAVRDFRRDKTGTIAFLIAFLASLGSYLLLLNHDKRYGKPEKLAVLSTVVRILVIIEGVLVIIAAFIGK